MRGEIGERFSHITDLLMERFLSTLGSHKSLAKHPNVSLVNDNFGVLDVHFSHITDLLKARI